MLGDDDFL